jgi:hypothetical protein
MERRTETAYHMHCELYHIRGHMSTLFLMRSLPSLLGRTLRGYRPMRSGFRVGAELASSPSNGL